MASQASLHRCAVNQSPLMRACRQEAGVDLRGTGLGPDAASAGAVLKEIAPAAAVQQSSPQVQRTISPNMSAILGSARKRVIFAPGDRVGHRQNADRSQSGYGALTIARTPSTDHLFAVPAKCVTRAQLSVYIRHPLPDRTPSHLTNGKDRTCNRKSKPARPVATPYSKIRPNTANQAIHRQSSASQPPPSANPAPIGHPAPISQSRPPLANPFALQTDPRRAPPPSPPAPISTLVPPTGEADPPRPSVSVRLGERYRSWLGSAADSPAQRAADRVGGTSCYAFGRR